MPGVVNIPSTTNSEGIVAQTSISTVFVNGQPIATTSNCFVTPHMHGSSAIPSVFVKGSLTVFANGSPILRNFDSAICGHSITSSSPNVFTS